MPLYRSLKTAENRAYWASIDRACEDLKANSSNHTWQCPDKEKCSYANPKGSQSCREVMLSVMPGLLRRKEYLRQELVNIQSLIDEVKARDSGGRP